MNESDYDALDLLLLREMSRFVVHEQSRKVVQVLRRLTFLERRLWAPVDELRHLADAADIHAGNLRRHLEGMKAQGLIKIRDELVQCRERPAQRWTWLRLVTDSKKWKLSLLPAPEETTRSFRAMEYLRKLKAPPQRALKFIEEDEEIGAAFDEAEAGEMVRRDSVAQTSAPVLSKEEERGLVQRVREEIEARFGPLEQCSTDDPEIREETDGEKGGSYRVRAGGGTSARTAYEEALVRGTSESPHYRTRAPKHNHDHVEDSATQSMLHDHAPCGGVEKTLSLREIEFLLGPEELHRLNMAQQVSGDSEGRFRKTWALRLADPESRRFALSAIAEIKTVKEQGKKFTKGPGETMNDLFYRLKRAAGKLGRGIRLLLW